MICGLDLVPPKPSSPLLSDVDEDVWVDLTAPKPSSPLPSDVDEAF